MRNRSPTSADKGGGPARSFLAPNPGPFTFDGTRSYVVGRDPVAVIDPGPADPGHLATLAEAVQGARRVTILLTHAHDDHSAGAAELAQRISAEVAGPGPAPGTGDDLGGPRPIDDGEAFDTSAGPLVAVFTPGHARHHHCYHLPRHDAVFTGDLILGHGDTTWIGEYAGGVADYLASLDRLDSLGARVLYPGHGKPLADPAEAVSRFRRHRLERIAQVRLALADGVAQDAGAIVRHIYGALPPWVFEMAVAGVEGMLEYLSATQTVESAPETVESTIETVESAVESATETVE